MLLPKPMKIAAVSGGLAAFGLIFGWVLFPVILKHQIKKEMALSKKTDVRQMWEKIPFALDFKIYFFNYTNVEEIQKGGIPIVKEVGPYYFEEWKEKVEIEDHDEDDTITYKKKDVFYFKPELSGPGLTGEETLVIPHLLLLGTIIATHRANAAMVGMVGKGTAGIFDKPTDVFMRVKAMDILFRGITINCARTEFAPKAICTAFKKEAVSGFEFGPNNQFRFSIFGTRNNTVDPHVVTVKRGIKNIMEVGAVIAVDGEPELKMWRDHCNQYDGTDNTIFPPFLTPNDRLASFNGDLCRSFKPWYQKKTSYKGIKTNHYVVNIGDFANDPELNCFCEAPDKCPPKGMMDMMKCMKAPIYASLPHFLECDSHMVSNVKGLNPNVEEHGIEVDFEPISGTPMMAKQRIQFNVELMKTDKYDIFKNLPGTMAPMFWIEEIPTHTQAAECNKGIANTLNYSTQYVDSILASEYWFQGLALNKTFVKMLKHQLFIPKRIVGVIRWWLLSFGCLGVLVGAILHFKDDIMRIATSGDNSKVTTVNSPAEDEQKEISVIGQTQEPAKVDM